MGSRKHELFGLAGAWLAVLFLSPGVCLGGPNLVAVGNFDLPALRAEGRYSLDGKSVIFEFPGEHDFGRVYVQASNPRVIIRNEMQVYYTGQSLVVDVRASDLNDPIVWIEFDLKGEVRPGRTYEYELDFSTEPEIAGGVPAIMPAMWVDGKPMGATVLLKAPIQTGDKIQRRLYTTRGTVDVKHFGKATGKASIIVKMPASFSGRVGVRRFTFREIDEEIVEGRTPEMPVPLRYIPIRAAVERQIDDALERTKTLFLRTQNDEGFWDADELADSIQATATIVAALAELGEPTDRGPLLQAMRWLAEQETAQGPPPQPPGPDDPGVRRPPPPRGASDREEEDQETFSVGTVAARLYCLARYDSKDKFRKTIAADVGFLADAQYPDGGWSNVSRKHQPVTAAGVDPDNSTSFAVIRALREAAFAGIPCRQVVWINAGKYWFKAQAHDGGFRQKLELYGGAGEATTIGRTAQGVMSLIASLQMAYGPGSRARSCEQYKAGRSQIRAVDHGLAWLEEFYGEDFKFGGGLQGQTATPYDDAWALQMFGAVSGIHEFDGKDHFRDQAGRLLDQTVRPPQRRYNPATALFGNNLLTTALMSLTLSSGASPTVFQRIVLGGPEAAAAELSGDAQHLVRYLMKQRNKPLNWRRTALNPRNSVRDTVREWLEVPMMYLNVAGVVTWKPEDARKLRDYCFNGGVVIVNVTQKYENQREAVMSGLRQAFPEYQARQLPPDHPLYSAREELENPLNVQAIGNGVKDFVFIFEEDWSCAFHMYKTKEHPEAFAFVNNLLDYTTDKSKLPSSFAGSTYPPGAATLREFRMRSFEVAGETPIYPDLLNSLDLSMQANYRVNVVDAGDGTAPLMWITFGGEGSISAEHKRRILDHVRSGGYLLVDVASGKEDWSKGAEAALRNLDPAITLRHMRAMHPIYTGKTGGTRGFDLRSAPLRKALTSKFVKSGRNEFLAVLHNGEEVGAFSAYDIASGVGYNRYPDCRGLRPQASRRLAMNVVLFAMQRQFQR